MSDQEYGNKPTSPTVTHVAIRCAGKVYALPKPNRHNHAIQLAVDDGVKYVGQHEQGFLDSTGRFLTREEAAAVAFEAGQIDRPTPGLFSEDLW